MGDSPIKTIELESDRPYISTEGMECPPTLMEMLGEEISDEEIHKVTLTGGTKGSKGRGETVIWMVTYPRGGNIEFDDGRHIIRRTFTDPEHAVDVFRATVDITIEEYERLNLNFDFEYSPGETEIEFETR